MNPSLPLQIGKCDLIEQVMIGDETLLKFSGVPLGEACSIVIRGATEQGCNSIDILNLRLDLGRKLRQGLRKTFRKAPDRAG